MSRVLGVVEITHFGSWKMTLFRVNSRPLARLLLRVFVIMPKGQ